ncbi:Cell division protein FtsX [Mucinivorans hirudinis]|uniref:Cell division protein FtsX n=1 Tax=Mucinivorans hirudinis TaxID=1433126 RepID=A0A060RBG7_9BACT|nr:Cell division protein FtsX [Mucinivorans hirudinis]
MNRGGFFASGVCLTLLFLLLGVASYFVLGAQRVAKDLSGGLSVSVFLASDITAQQRQAIEDAMKADKEVASFEYIDSQRATIEFENATGIKVREVLDENPIPSSYEIKPLSAESAATIESRVGEWEGVISTLYPKDVSGELTGRIRVINGVILGVAALVLIVALSLIYFTLKLSVLASADTIRTMQLVGARRSFIKRPYVRRAAVQGLVSSLLAAGLLVAMSRVLGDIVEVDWEQLGVIAAAMVAVGVLLNLLFTVVVLRMVVK